VAIPEIGTLAMLLDISGKEYAYIAIFLKIGA
jgi:hypothetical protein